MLREVVTVQVKRLSGNSDVPLPTYQTAAAAAMDVHAAVDETLQLLPGEWALVPCGFALAVPPGFEAQIRPRSGLAAKQGLTVLNSPGTIDSDYRGEVKVILINLGKNVAQIERGARIAQILVLPVPQVLWDEVTDLPASVRGESGFGHTGK